MKSYYVYILTNKKNGVLYISVTNYLMRRIHEHKNKMVKGFTSKYNLTKLVYYAETNDISAAITEEKRMKRWYRKWKIELIEEENPDWLDLAKDWYN